jgi:hypothetical protein
MIQKALNICFIQLPPVRFSPLLGYFEIYVHKKHAVAHDHDPDLFLPIKWGNSIAGDYMAIFINRTLERPESFSGKAS